MFAGRYGSERCMTTRQYARLVSGWIASIGLDPHIFGTHSLRRTKATLIYRRTGNLLRGKVGSPATQTCRLPTAAAVLQLLYRWVQVEGPRHDFIYASQVFDFGDAADHLRD